MPSRSKSPWESKRDAYAYRERRAGRPLRVFAGTALAHRDMLRDAGMTDHQIADLATANGYPIHQTTISILGTKNGHCHRDTEKAILSVRPTTPSPHKLVDATPARRYLQALVLAGFSQNWLSHNVLYERKSHERGHLTYVNGILHKRYGQIELGTLQRVERNAQKLEFTDPHDVGIVDYVVSRSKNLAREAGWAPLKCWDEDTIRDPLAAPEWTGACGTMEGRRIHYRDKIFPLCRNCVVIHQIYRRYPHLTELMGSIGELRREKAA